MKWIIRAYIFGLGTFFGVAICVAIFVYSYSEKKIIPHISVSIVNNSDYGIMEIKIDYKGGFIVHRGLAKKDQLTLPVYRQGEGAYTILVKLENGLILEGGVGYVESGYSTQEVIFNDRIESFHRSYN